MTFDQFVRFCLIPALGTGAFVALVVTLREEWRDRRADHDKRTGAYKW